MKTTFDLRLSTFDRRPRRRKGIILLLVVSLLALFVLLGATFTLVALQALHASKLELQVNRYGDDPTSEIDLVLGQILYDTQARTVLQYHSLLRDLYGYDANIFSNGINTLNINEPRVVPQFRESVDGFIPQANAQPPLPPPAITPTANGQLVTFNFALPLAPTSPVNPYAVNGYVFPNNVVPLPFAALSPIPNYYAGRVITFKGPGAAANHSARIVAYQPISNLPTVSGQIPTPATGSLTIESIESKLSGTVLPSPGDTFVINGAPFNGSGAGYYYNPIDSPLVTPPNVRVVDPLNHGLNAFINGNQNLQVSLLPNLGGYPANVALYSYSQTAGAPGSTLADYGGVDEPWDAPDLQNMFLAMVPPRAAELYAAGNPANYLPILPSFHRPELVNFWLNNTPAGFNLTSATLNPASADFARTFIFRPMPWDHPNFSGSNPFFATQNASQLLINLANPNNLPLWDVDNDGDGIPESIWIDPGLPVITNPDGKRYKRLAAIYIQDLDGRIQLNAHGNLAQVADNRFRAEFQPFLQGNTNWLAGSVAAPGLAPGVSANYQVPPVAPTAGVTALPPVLGTMPALNGAIVPQPPVFGPLLAAPGYQFLLPRGSGYGPAEVDFMKILTATTPAYNDAVAKAAYTRLLTARYTSNYANDASPGRPLLINAVLNGDPLATIKSYGVPNDYGNLTGQALATWYAQPSWYASPPDVWGRGALVLDVGGQPLYTFQALTGETLESPYEICLSGENNGFDTPYTATELERMLRYNDPDSNQIFSRPFVAAPQLSTESPGVIGPSGHIRAMLSGMGSDIPTPATTIPAEMRGLLGPAFAKIPGQSSILDLYYARLAPTFVNTPYAPQLPFEMLKIVPWEFFKGQKFDLNRPFGDGVDNDYATTGNYARDDELESIGAFSAEYGWPATAVPANIPAAFANIPHQTTNGVDIVNGGPLAGNPPASLGNPAILADNLRAKQLYARHLFCLAMLCLPPNFLNPANPTSFPTTDIANPPGSQNNNDIALNNFQNYQYAMIRRIAQWAVNCVDYRDSDSIMTPFEFDYNPWNGWNVDGNLATDGKATGQPELIVVTTNTGPVLAQNLTPPANQAAYPGDNGERGVVWGMEQPDLIITESLATHDRRVKDTKFDTTTKNRSDTPDDPTLDQFRVPQGSLFLELYCPRSNIWPGENGNQKSQLPLELYDTNGRLMLGKLAPSAIPANNNLPQWPVWRIALSRIETTNTNPNQIDWHPFNAVGDGSQPANPESASMEPNAPLILPSGGATPQPPALIIDRYAYLGTTAGMATMGASPQVLQEQAKGFYTTANPVLSPGQYAVVGPRDVTYFGSQDPQNATPAAQPGSGPGGFSLWGGNSPQAIRIAPGAVTVTDNNGTVTSRATPPATPATAQVPLGIICQFPIGSITPNNSNAPYQAIGTPWANPNPWPIGVNITEPMPLGNPTLPSNYYPEPDPTISWTGMTSTGYNYRDFYDNPDIPNSLLPNTPFDTNNATAGAGRPIGRTSMSALGTYTNVSCAFVQRLANPNLPFNPPPFDDRGNPDPLFNSALVYPGTNIPIINPYITIDWHSLDVHVFNGEEFRNPSTYTGPPGSFDPDDPNVANTGSAASPLRFRTRQRGIVQNVTTAFPSSVTQYQPTSNPWPPSTGLSFNRAPGGPATVAPNRQFEGLPNTALPPVNGPYFGLPLSDSQYNQYAYDPVGNHPSNMAMTPDRHTLGYINSTVDYPVIQNNSPIYFGEPAANPPPWLNWNNRPFTNAMELLAVPASSPGRFFVVTTPGFPPPAPVPPPVAYPAGSAPTALPFSPYLDLYTAGIAPNGIGTASAYLPFGQLLNFFQTAPTLPIQPNLAGTAPHLYRLLDYVEVPSPFVGTERWYNPQSFGNFAAPNFGPGTNLNAPFYRPPFNKLSRFRDPGKININTIFDLALNPITVAQNNATATLPANIITQLPADIWDSAVGQFPGMRGIDNFGWQLFMSRQGDYGNPGSPGTLYGVNRNYPTRFANPFRPADSSDLMPLAGGPLPASNLQQNQNMRKFNPIEATLLRPDSISQFLNQANGRHQPLFRISELTQSVTTPAGSIAVQLNPQYNNWVGAPPGAMPLPTAGQQTYTGQYHDITRNPYFAYQPLQKVGNVLTTRSNCFAVWITIGYFEVEDNITTNAGVTQVTYDPAHPDGLRLGQEIGFDTGEVTRHRGFFIIDRSIPVGFVPGSRLNTDDCILVRRLIE